MIDQVTSLSERGVMECILSGHAGVSKELLVTVSDMSKCLVLWRLLLEYINLIILRTFYGKLCACANSVYQAVFFGLGTRLVHIIPQVCPVSSSKCIFTFLTNWRNCQRGKAVCDLAQGNLHASRKCFETSSAVQKRVCHVQR